MPMFVIFNNNNNTNKFISLSEKETASLVARHPPMQN